MNIHAGDIQPVKHIQLHDMWSAFSSFQLVSQAGPGQATTHRYDEPWSEGDQPEQKLGVEVEESDRGGKSGIWMNVKGL